MALTSGKYGYDSNGNLTYQVSDFNKFMNFGNGTPDEDIQRYLLEFNQANQQWNQQHALNQEAFAFNKDLSMRQQDLAEESYRSGVLNQARQLSALGINPASVGGSISGQAMSGGSGVTAGTAGFSPHPSSQPANKRTESLAMFSALNEMANKKKELEIQNKQADNQGKLIDSQVGVNESTSEFNRLNAKRLEVMNRQDKSNLDFYDSYNISPKQMEQFSTHELTAQQAYRLCASLDASIQAEMFGNGFKVGASVGSESSGSSSERYNAGTLYMQLYDNHVIRSPQEFNRLLYSGDKRRPLIHDVVDEPVGSKGMYD